VDLAGWAEERFRIPGEPVPTDTEPEDHAAPARPRGDGR
jgi:hypothetical protein